MTFQFFQSFSLNLLSKVYNFSSDSIKFGLTNTAPNLATANQYSDLSGTELATGAGYTAGGQALTSESLIDASGTTIYHATAPTWTATGALGPFRYVFCYDDSAGSKQLVGMADRGASLTLASGDTYSPSIDGTTGLFSAG